MADRVRGCLLGGALGDALGAPVEFLSLDGIRARYGPRGIVEPPTPALVTDDTQMTLFTADGIIRASTRWRDKGVCHPPSVVWRAYVRWLSTQDPQAAERVAQMHDTDGLRASGWLDTVPELRHRRAPGMTCLGALSSGVMGSVEQPINDSKGCGVVMRVAPAGFLGSPSEAWQYGCEFAA